MTTELARLLRRLYMIPRFEVFVDQRVTLHLYLGRLDYETLRQDTSDRWTQHVGEPDRWDGMKVFVVDTPRHVEITAGAAGTPEYWERRT